MASPFQGPQEQAARPTSRRSFSNSHPLHGRMNIRKSYSDMGDDLPSIVIGICAMDKKAMSKPMREITKRLVRAGEFRVVNFGDDVILNKPVEEWPVVQCLLSWFSDGFPLPKAELYARLRRPYLVNDLAMQHLLQDRRSVYHTLKSAGISVPKHVVVSRTAGEVEAGLDPEGFEEFEDYIVMNGSKIDKPFVEKPASGEDHNIYIYYPHSMGGGVKRLFRKVDDKSADYDPNHPGTVRRDGSYLYEVFLATGGTDVKVYTVGPRYAHAEARKSPVVDGRVQRAADGKEIRFPVLLSPHEKEIARTVSMAFGQKICGFDLLRSEKGKSYVCDVNGWSFVKSSSKYYDDAAGLLRSIIISAVAPHRLNLPVPQPPLTALDVDGNETTIRQCTSVGMIAEEGEQEPPSNTFEELRCVLAIIRHGDRTPKQKLKMKVTQQPFLNLLMKHMDSKGKQAKLKSPGQLSDLLEVTVLELNKLEAALLETARLEDPSDTVSISSKTSAGAGPSDDEFREKLRIVKTILEQGGHFSGINRKAQLKPLKWVDGDSPESPARCVEALLILKHGGVLTHAGREQAEQLGLNFRMVMYPNQGGLENGLLRLHSTYRHDLKIYTADEGRVQSSAAAFTKGLLDLEGSSLTPILVSLVKKDATMLDAFGKGASADIRRAKAALYHQITEDCEAIPGIFVPEMKPGMDDKAEDAPSIKLDLVLEDGDQDPSAQGPRHIPMVKVKTGFHLDDLEPGPGTPGGASGTPKSQNHLTFEDLNIPIKGLPEDSPALCHRLVQLVQGLVDKLRDMCISERGDSRSSPYSALTQDPSEWVEMEGQPCGGERMLLMFDRWRKLLKSFYNTKTDKFDISKLPDIYDSIKYDAIHNANLSLDYRPIYDAAHKLATVVIPSEYGIADEDKQKIGSKISCKLLGKILADLSNMRDESLATASMELTDNLFQDSTGNWVDPHVLETPNMDSAADALEGQSDEEGDEDEEGTMHRLCPTYANDVNSPLRHVRTRIYFTSESHIHSLVNVLRYCHVGYSDDNPLIGPEGESILEKAAEKDYLTQIVFQLYEDKRVPVEDPKRFRVEIAFSDGSAHNPFEVVSAKQGSHVLPVKKRQFIHRDQGVSLETLEEAIQPFSETWRQQGSSQHYISKAGSGSASYPNLVKGGSEES